MRGKSRELKNEWGTISLVTAVSPSPDSDAHFLSSHPGEPRDAISEVGESWRYEGAMAKSGLRVTPELSLQLWQRVCPSTGTLKERRG